MCEIGCDTDICEKFPVEESYITPAYDSTGYRQLSFAEKGSKLTKRNSQNLCSLRPRQELRGNQRHLLTFFRKMSETLRYFRIFRISNHLFAFNDEALVRAIATSKMPVIAAVGHEIDSTLVDFVADKRASTPTGAAELATVDVREIEQKFDYAIETMKNAIADKLEEMKQEYLDLKESLSENMETKLLLLSKDVEKYKEKLSALNPNNVLSRGYSISMNAEGKVVKNVRDIKLGDKLITVLKDGKVVSKVEEKEGK